MTKRIVRPNPALNPWHAEALPPAVRLTKFRSQLEIRFALELEARHLRWFYEPMRLGESRYLVDFYLPDRKAWVEVKGQVSSRDHTALREVAVLLASERHHALYMWTSQRAYLVGAADFKAMPHEAFWALLCPTPLPTPDTPSAPETPPA